MLLRGRTLQISLAILAQACVAAIASGDVVYTSQQRYVFGRVGSSGDLTDEQRNAPNFAPFADEVHLQYAFLSATARTDVTQSSTLGATEIAASASAFAIGSGSNPVGFAVSRVLISVRFLVTNASTYRLDGSLDWTTSVGMFPPSPPSLWVRLTGPTGVVFNMQRGASNSGSLVFTGPNALTGVLTTGEYNLEAWIEGSGAGSGGNLASYNFSLAIPSPGTPLILGATALALASRRRRASR